LFEQEIQETIVADELEAFLKEEEQVNLHSFVKLLVSEGFVRVLQEELLEALEVEVEMYVEEEFLEEFLEEELVAILDASIDEVMTLSLKPRDNLVLLTPNLQSLKDLENGVTDDKPQSESTVS